MTHSVNTETYERENNHKPRGCQTWVFIYDKYTKSMFNGIWHDAREHALRFRRLGCYEEVEVQS